MGFSQTDDSIVYNHEKCEEYEDGPHNIDVIFQYYHVFFGYDQVSLMIERIFLKSGDGLIELGKSLTVKHYDYE